MSRQTILRLAVAVTALGFYAATAHAQLVNPFGTEAIGISADESARIKAALREVLAKYANGARADWQSANGKRAGSAVITNTYAHEGRRCAVVQHTFTKGGGYPLQLPLCEIAKDEWRIAF
jgi:surface antigen